MARPLRLEFHGALYHVTSRGNRQESIFLDDADRQNFLDLLGKEVSRLVERLVDPGEGSVEWDAGGVPSGLYYARMTAVDAEGKQVFQSTRTLVVMK